MSEPATDHHRRAVAARNDAAILDAAERLLDARRPLTVAAVANEAGVSRVTVYAHFAGIPDLLEATARRAVERALGAVRAAEPESGPAPEALDRLVGVSWQALDREAALARATAAQLPSDRLRAVHAAMMAPLRALIDRGRAEGAFRADLPADWLVTVFYALLHAAGDDVRAGRLDADRAADALRATLHGALGAR